MRLDLPSLAIVALALAACSSSSEEAGDASMGGATEAPVVTEQPEVAATPIPTGPEPGSQADLVANVGDRVFFEFDRYDLRADSRATVERWAAWLKNYPQVTVTLEGHADERGTRDYNLALGERRANGAMELMQSLGINPNRVRVVSYGKERPAVLGSSESAYAQNRRSVLVVD